MPENDSVMRAMTNDGAFRVIAARTTDTVRGVVAAQNLSGALAHDMADLLSTAVLYRETMAPSLRVQCIVRFEEEAGQLVADSHPDGWTRGLLQAGTGDAPPDIRKTRATLQMMRTLPNSDLHRGVVEVPESGNLSEGFMRYMQLSEQIVSMISLGSVVEGENPTAGGFVVQLLPEAADAEAAMETMTRRLEDFVEIRERLQRVRRITVSADRANLRRHAVHLVRQQRHPLWLSVQRGPSDDDAQRPQSFGHPRARRRRASR